VRELAPEGVAADFDHVGGPGIVDSWRMLARGGSLVSYGTASTRDAPGNPRLPVLKLIARLTLRNVLPNGRRATFFNLWAGARKRDRYRARLRRDLGEVLRLLQQGAIDAQIARRFPLRDAGRALRYAEQGQHRRQSRSRAQRVMPPRRRSIDRRARSACRVVRPHVRSRRAVVSGAPAQHKPGDAVRGPDDR
jgi:NADPH:quinone reductase-like Zn-dependent oxidoreductase